MLLALRSIDPSRNPFRSSHFKHHIKSKRPADGRRGCASATLPRLIERIDRILLVCRPILVSVIRPIRASRRRVRVHTDC